MLNLLTENDKRETRRIYAGRVLAVAFLVSIAAGIFGTLALLPSYFFISVRTAAAEERMALLEKSIAARSAEATNPVLADARKKLAELSRTTRERPRHSFFESVMDVRIPEVHITGLSYDAAKDGGTIRVYGIADAREPLTRFVKRLEREGSFTSVDLPVSDLAASSDIKFTVSARGAF